MKILIADDDEVSRRFLKRTVTASGHDVITAHNGVEAWSALQCENAPRLAILDWMMPGMGPTKAERHADLHHSPNGKER